MSVVCMESRAEATASPLTWASSGSVCVICAQLSPVPVTSERGTCTSQQHLVSATSLGTDGRLHFHVL